MIPLHFFQPSLHKLRACWCHNGPRCGVVWYTGQFYALFFLTISQKVDFQTAYILIAISLVIGTPFFVFFGPAECHFNIFVGPWSKFGDCDRAKDFLTKSGLSFTSTVAAAGTKVDRQYLCWSLVSDCDCVDHRGHWLPVPEGYQRRGYR